MRLDSKVALITGAASGIGLATAQIFAQAGAQLALLDRDVDGLHASATVVTCPEPLALLPIDVANRQAVADAVREVLDRFDRIDVLINQAAVVADWDLAAEVPNAVWDEILGINLQGVVNMCQVVVPVMQQGASIINTSSICGTVRACATRAPYDVAKAGVVAFTRDLAVAYGPRGIRANALVPGFIDTPMSRRLIDGHEERARAEVARIPLRRIGLAEEVARASLFLASDAASYITGSMLFVDGGLSLV